MTRLDAEAEKRLEAMIEIDPNALAHALVVRLVEAILR